MPPAPAPLFSALCSDFASKNPEAAALHLPGGQKVSWREWTGQLHHWAAGLRHAGLTSSDAAAIMMEDPGLALTVTAGTSFAARSLPLDARLPPPAVTEILLRSGAKRIFTDPAIRDRLPASAIPPGCRMEVVTAPLRTDFTPLQSPPSATDIAFLMATSGSTGEPRLVPVTHGAMAVCLASARLRPALSPADCAMSVLPLSTIHGLLTGCLLTLSAGGSVALPGPFAPDRFLDWLNRHPVTWFSLPPAMHRALLDHAPQCDAALRPAALRFVRSAAAPLPAELIPPLEQFYGVPLTEAYGMTEALNISVAAPDARRTGSTGPSIGPEIQIRDAGGQALPAFTPGNIVLRGPTVAAQYYDGTATLKTPDGWLVTGDTGWLDDDGYLYVSGRQAEVINRGGSKVALSQVERHLVSCPGVAEAAAAGIPHDRLGQDIVAAVVMRPGSRSTPETIRRELLRRIPIAQVPSQIIAVESLPVTLTGKIRRAELTVFLQSLCAALPAPGPLPPANAFEEWVRQHMENALGRPLPSAGHDFFAAGGDSLAVAALAAQLSESLGQTVHPVAITAAATPAQLARLLRTDYPEGVRRLSMEPAPPDGASGPAPEPEGASGLRPQGHLGRSVDLPAPAFPERTRRTGKPKTRRPVFILSAPRSGSTLLRAMLAGHPGLFAPPELSLAGHPSMASWAREHSGSGALFREGLIQAVMSARNVSFESASAWVTGAIAADRPVTWVYEKLQSWIKPRRLVDKTPIYALRPAAMSAMEASLGEPFYIHLTRHPGSFAQSYTRTRLGPSAARSPLGLLSGNPVEEVWLLAQRNVLEFLEDIPVSSQIRIAYEDLIRSPEQVLRTLCRLLGIDFHPAVLQPYAEPEKRMLHGVQPSSKMIGDPDFHRRTRLLVPENDPGHSAPPETLHPETRHMAALLGYHDPGPETAGPLPELPPLEETFLQHQRRLLQNWCGVSPEPDSWVAGRHLTGTRPPLIWCFQAEAELDALARALGHDQPVIGLRSGHMVFDGDHPRMEQLSRIYCAGLLRRGARGAGPGTPWILGGNCGGGKIAWGMAHALTAAGQPPALLILMEVNPLQPLPHAGYESPVSLIYGRQSERNPLLQGPDPESRISRCLGDWTLDQIEGSHGRYFDHPHRVRELASLLRRRMSGALNRRAVSPV